MQVRSLGQEGPLEKKMAMDSSILAQKNPMDLWENRIHLLLPWQATVHEVAKRVRHDLATEHYMHATLLSFSKTIRDILTLFFL